METILYKYGWNPSLDNEIYESLLDGVSGHIIHTSIFHFTDGEGLLIDFRYFLLYH